MNKFVSIGALLTAVITQNVIAGCYVDTPKICHPDTGIVPYLCPSGNYGYTRQTEGDVTDPQLLGEQAGGQSSICGPDPVNCVYEDHWLKCNGDYIVTPINWRQVNVHYVCGDSCSN